MRYREISEAMVEYETTKEQVKAAAKVCRKAMDYARDKPIRIEVKPYMVHGYCHGILLTDLYADQPGSGQGTPLMKYLLNLADEAGLNVYTNAEGPRSADFYRKLGFETDQTGRNQLVWYPDMGEDYDYLKENQEQYATTLDEQGLIDYAWDSAHPDEASGIDPHFIEEMFAGASAILRRVPIKGLKFNGGVEVYDKTSEYSKLSTEAPPIIVNGWSKEVMDGNHRVRIARARGQRDILAYVVTWEEEPI